MDAERPTAYGRWLDGVHENVKPTPKGVRLDLTRSVYPDGHGNLYVRNPETGKLDEPGQPVGKVDEATAAFRAAWERAAGYPKGGPATG